MKAFEKHVSAVSKKTWTVCLTECMIEYVLLLSPVFRMLQCCQLVCDEWRIRGKVGAIDWKYPKHKKKGRRRRRLLQKQRGTQETCGLDRNGSRLITGECRKIRYKLDKKRDSKIFEK